MHAADAGRLILGDEGAARPLRLEPVGCPICASTDAEPVGVGYDFEYATTGEAFVAVRCSGCGLVYLDMRPPPEEARTIYPDDYHAFDFGPDFGIPYRIRRWLEARRLREWTKGLPPDARILDVGCGDGFHLDLLRAAGPATWQLEGVDFDRRAVAAARGRGLRVHEGRLADVDLEPASYDLVVLLATIEHVEAPLELLRRIQSLLKPGGRVGVATDNTESPSYRLFEGGYWGGYHFPRHFHLFSPDNLTALAVRAGLEPLSVRTATNPVNWVYSVRNVLVAHNAPAWVLRRFTLRAPVSLGVFTVVDEVCRRFRKGSLIRATFRRLEGGRRASLGPPVPALATGADPVLILGAGFAGLIAARELDRRGVPALVFEAAPQVGGLARSFHDDEGFAYDFGAHFITNRLAAALGVGSQCRIVRRYDESVLLHGRVYGYPFGLLRSPRFVASAAASVVTGVTDRDGPSNARIWFERKYGSALASEVAIPLLEAWSGAEAAELAPSVGDKMPGTLESMWLKTAARMSGRAIGCGYSGAQPESWNVWHVYPREGVGRIVGDLAAGLEDRIRLESPVERIHVENGRVRGVTSHGEFHPSSCVFSTAPVHILARLVEDDRLSFLRRFRYRPMVFVNLLLKGRGLLPSTMFWTPENRFPFFRLAEAPLSMPWLAPERHTIITADLGCEVGDSRWKMEDDELVDLCLATVNEIVPGIRDRYLRARVLRTPFAYPVYLNEYEAERRRFQESTGIVGLYSIGRNGRFSHDLMEDVYWRTRRATNASLVELGEGVNAFNEFEGLHR